MTAPCQPVPQDRRSGTRGGLVHICGFPSGGTDLLRNIMSSHPDIAIAGEFPLLPSLPAWIGPEVPGRRVPALVEAMNRIDVYRNFGDPAPDLSALTARETVRLAEVYRAMLGRPEVAWEGNKTPQNAENIDRLRRLFPDGRLVLVVRDVRDVCLSWRAKWGRNPLPCAERWRARMWRALDALDGLPPGQGMVVRYEDVLSDLETVARDLCGFLGLGFAPEMLTYHRHVAGTIDGKRKFGQPVDPANAGKWRNAFPEATVRRVEEIAFETMGRLGYPPELAQGPRPITAWERRRGFTHDLCATLLVGNRYSSHNGLGERIRRSHVMLRRRLQSS